MFDKGALTATYRAAMISKRRAHPSGTNRKKCKVIPASMLLRKRDTAPADDNFSHLLFLVLDIPDRAPARKKCLNGGDKSERLRSICQDVIELITLSAAHGATVGQERRSNEDEIDNRGVLDSLILLIQDEKRNYISNKYLLCKLIPWKAFNPQTDAGVQLVNI